MRFTIDAVISALALLLVLAGALWLPLVGASTADMNVTLTVTGEDDGGGNGGGSSGSGATVQQPSTPVTPIVAPPEQPKPLGKFVLVDYVPKIIPAYRDTPIVLYGYNFPSDFKIIVKAKNAMLVADSAMVDKTKAVIGGAVLEAVQYVIPAKTLTPGEAVLVIQQADKILTQPLSILVYDPVKAVNLRAQIAQRTINVTATGGQSANVTVKFKNIGLTDWDYLLQPLHIGTDRPHDRKSKFVHKDWPYSNRVAKVDLPMDVKTGEIFDVTFPIQAPTVKRTTRYTENFALVTEGIAWIPGSEFSIRVTVLPVTNQTLLDKKLTVSGDSLAKDDSLITSAPTSPSTTVKNGVVPIDEKLNLAPASFLTTAKAPSPYKMPSEIRSTARWMSVKTVLNNWFAKPVIYLFATIGKLWR